MKTGVLVHGCNLNIENWRHVAWGDPPHRMGRIPQGILIASQFDAQVVVFGTGASSKPFRLGGGPAAAKPLLEAEYSLEYLRQYFDSLQSFEPIREHFAADGDQQWPDFRARMLAKIQLDTECQNTIEEIQAAAKVFLQHDVQRIILVSSPSHVVRCLRDATALFAEHPDYRRWSHQILACPSNTCYEGTTPGDVVVVEPPHRPDRHVVPTHRRIQRMLALQKLEHDDLVQLIEQFDDLLQRFEHRCFIDSHINGKS